MKKIFPLLLIVVCLGRATAQDIIYTTDGQTIEARKITREGNVYKYSLYSASIMDRSRYSIEASRVQKIKYEDGHTSSNTSQQIPTPAQKTQEVSKQESRDTVVVYAIATPNKQLTPSLFNAYPPYKSPALAFISSLALPGLGQLYNDEMAKGFVFMGIDIVALGVGVANLNNDNALTPVCFVVAGITSLIASVEAALTANSLNEYHKYITYIPPQSESLLYSSNNIPCLSLAFNF